MPESESEMEKRPVKLKSRLSQLFTLALIAAVCFSLLSTFTGTTVASKDASGIHKLAAFPVGLIFK